VGSVRRAGMSQKRGYNGGVVYYITKPAQVVRVIASTSSSMLLGRGGTVEVTSRSTQPNRRQKTSWMPGPGYPIDKDTGGAYKVHNIRV